MSIKEDRQQLLSDRLDNPYDYKHIGKSPKTLTLTLLGDKGTGKTLFMCIIGLIYQLFGVDFYSNFWMSNNITHRKPFSIRDLYRNPNVRGIFLDEMHNITDQNSNQSVETKLLVALFTQSRKREQLLIFSSLRFYMLAKDIRNLTNILVYPEFDERKDILTLTFWDIRNDKVITRKINGISRFFKYYDTYEIVVSEQIKTQLSSFLLKHKKLETEIKKKLDKEERELLNGIEGSLKK